MTLPENDLPREWVKEQMDLAEIPEEDRGPIWQLLNAWHLHRHRAKNPDQVLDVFNKLARDHTLEPKHDVNLNWVPVRPGNIHMRDRVRVKTDAYKGEVGRVHNGKLGVVVRISGGDVVVKYDNTEPGATGVHHSPYALDRLL